MKRIGILTFHFADNYGAVLQSYALRRVINSFPECNAEIINYVPSDFFYAKTWQNEYEHMLFEKKRESFRKFLLDYCGVRGEVRYTIPAHGEYDYYVAGSDQIWTTDPILDEYFLPHISKGAKRVSYAASIGINPDNPNLKYSVLREGVSRFDAVSVRETGHVSLIEKLTGKKCYCTLDPTLLLDEKDYEALVSKQQLKNKPFIFFFWLRHDRNKLQGVAFANALSRKLEVDIVHYDNTVSDDLFFSDGGCMQFEGVENFLWYVKNAEYVITNSYHCTIFSILFRKPFYTFGTETMNLRIETLKEKLPVAERIIESYLDINKVNTKMDYIGIYERLKQERGYSLSYLKHSLDIM